MKALKFISGFLWNICSMLICALPMSIDMGAVCVKKDKFFWQIDEEELLDAATEEE